MGAATLAATRWMYDFADGASDMRALLGGKGANVAEMTRVLGPDLVPAGFTITTEACVASCSPFRVPLARVAAAQAAARATAGEPGDRPAV